MILDPTIDVMCDTCGEQIIIEGEYKYTDYTGNTGYYDFSKNVIEKTLKQQGWKVKDDAHYCPECVTDE